MVQTLLPMLPREQGTMPLVFTLAAAGAGLLLWAMGARFSRTIVTLVLVTLGAVVGDALPAMFSWSINAMACSVGAAVVLGVLGFMMHRMWIGVGLGIVLSLWASVATWMLCSNGAVWTYPSVEGLSLVQFARAVWDGLPDDVKKFLPYACGGAMISGIASTILWPRVAMVLMYSALGASMATAMSLTAMENWRPAWISHLPAQTWAQLTVLGAVVLFGAVLQWQLSPTRNNTRAPDEVTT